MPKGLGQVRSTVLADNIWWSYGPFINEKCHFLPFPCDNCNKYYRIFLKLGEGNKCPKGSAMFDRQFWRTIFGGVMAPLLTKNVIRLQFSFNFQMTHLVSTPGNYLFQPNLNRIDIGNHYFHCLNGIYILHFSYNIITPLRMRGKRGISILRICLFFFL